MRKDTHQRVYRRSKKYRQLQNEINCKFNKNFKPFPKEISKIIAGYTATYCLLPWIDESKLSGWISALDVSIDWLEADPRRIDWANIQSNSSAYELIRNKPDIEFNDYIFLNRDSHILSMINDYHGEFEWEYRSMNPSDAAISICLANPEKIVWSCWSSNKTTGDRVYEHHKANLDKVDWLSISSNSAPWAEKLLKEHIEKMSHYWTISNGADWTVDIMLDALATNGNINTLSVSFIDQLSSNPNPRIMHILRINIEKINWWKLSQNPGAIDILLENLDKIQYSPLSNNPGIFELRGSMELVNLLTKS